MVSFRRSLLAALALHALAALLLARARVASSPPGQPEAVTAFDVGEVEVETTESPATPPTSPLEPFEPQRIAKAEARPRAATHGGPSSAETSAAEDGSAGPGASPAGNERAHTAEGEAAPTLSLAQLGLDGNNRFLGREPTSRKDRPEAAVMAQIRRDLDARDRALGLDAAGPVISALEAATRESDTAANSKAVFYVEVDASGAVTDVRVSSVSQDMDGYRRVAQAAKEALRGKRMRAAGPRGVALSIEVESRWQLPSGSDPGMAVEIAGTTAKAGQTARSPKISLLKPEIALVPLDLDPGGGGSPVRVPMVKMTIFDFQGDPTDMIQRPLRTVRAHVVDETHH